MSGWYDGAIWPIAFSPSGEIATANDVGLIAIWGASDAAPVRSFSIGKQRPEDMTFLDADRLRTIDDEAVVTDRSAADGHVLGAHRFAGQTYGMSPRGDYVAIYEYGDTAALRSGSVTIWRVEDERLLLRATDTEMVCCRVSFSSSPDRVAITYTTTTGNWRLMSRVHALPSGDRLADLPSMNWPTISPAGDEVVHDDFRLVILQSTDGSIRWQTVGGGYPTFAFSPDGEYLAVAPARGLDIAPRILSTKDGRLVKTLHGAAGTAMYLRFSPDGKWIAVGGNSNEVGLWRVAR
jgi:WD40 repeat protein